MNTKLVISGCLGRMGKSIARIAFVDPEIKLIAGIEASDSPSIGLDLGSVALGEERDALIMADLKDCIADTDVVIDFSSTAATLNNLKIISKHVKSVVIGTTGFNEKELEDLKSFSRDIAILISPNMSIGINVLFNIIPQLTQMLGDDYDIEIVESHHNQKKDAPSGTAKRIAQLIKDIRKDLVLNYGREGSNTKREKNELAIHALRLGEIVGEHKIIFAGNNEVIKLSHLAISRDIFAKGAILGAKYIKSKKAGLYTMQDVLSAKLSG